MVLIMIMINSPLSYQSCPSTSFPPISTTYVKSQNTRASSANSDKSSFPVLALPWYQTVLKPDDVY